MNQFRLTFIENSSSSVLFLKDADPNWSQGVRMCRHIQCKEHGTTHNTHMCALVLTLADMMHSDSLTTNANVSLLSKKSSHQCSYKDRWSSTHTQSARDLGHHQRNAEVIILHVTFNPLKYRFMSDKDGNSSSLTLTFTSH